MILVVSRLAADIVQKIHQSKLSMFERDSMKAQQEEETNGRDDDDDDDEKGPSQPCAAIEKSWYYLKTHHTP